MGTGASQPHHNSGNKANGTTSTSSSNSMLSSSAASMPSSAAVNAAAAASAGGANARRGGRHHSRSSRLSAIIPMSAVERLSCLPWARLGIQPPPPPVKIPPVPVYLGSNLSRSTIFNRLKTLDGTSNPLRIIFIFGGPGTFKGRVIDDILNMFGMQLLSGENIIIKHLLGFFSQQRKSERDKQQAERMAKMPIGGGFGARPKSPTPSLTSIDHKLTEIRGLENIEMKKLQELLRMRPELLTLEWLMDRVADEIEYSVHRDRCTGFVVDIMPNQRFLLKSEYLIKDCTAELAAFEERFPIALCLNLAMPQEKLLDNLDAAHKAGEKNLNGASGAAGSSSSLSSIASNATTTSNASGTASTPAAAAGDEPLPTLPSGQSDEMDASRMQKRYTLYESSAYYFLTYFVQTGRVLTIDCSSKLPALIWQKLCDSVIELGFVPDRPSSVVIIFGFEPDTFASFDLSKYRIKHVYLADILNEQHVDAKLLSPEQACHVLNQHVHDAMANATAFAVELSGTSLASHVARPQSSTASLKSARIDSAAVVTNTSGNRSAPNNKPNSMPVRGVGQTPKVSPAHHHQHQHQHATTAASQKSSSGGGGILHKNDTNIAPIDPASSLHPTSSTSVAPRLLPQLVSPRQKEDLLFVEIHEVMLDKYVQLQSGNVRKLKRKNSLSTRRFKAICLPEQELVCLFPDSVDTRTCKAISAGIVNAKRQVYRERRDSSRRSSNQSESLAAAAASDNHHNNNTEQCHSNTLAVGGAATGSRVSLVSPMPPLPTTTSRLSSTKLIPPVQPSRL